MKKITLTDLEQQTGFSKSTISRVLTGHGYVEESTRVQIERAIESTGYARNKSKRHKADLSDLIMVTSALLKSEVQVTIIEGVIARLHKAGKKTAIMYNAFTSGSNTEEYLLYAKQNGFGGVIMLGALENPSMLNVLKRMDVPLVLLNQNLRGLDVDIVDMDDYRGAYIAMEKLFACGHTRIGFLGGYKNTTTVMEREAGYRDAMRDAGLTVEKQNIFYGDFRQEGGGTYATTLAKQQNPPTAVISCNDLMSIGFANGCNKKGLSIPQDISLITFDNTSFTRGLSVRLTSVDYEFEQMGTAAAQLLLNRIRHPDNATRKITFSPRLYEGESVRELLERK